jgi:hypothetical protein
MGVVDDDCTAELILHTPMGLIVGGAIPMPSDQPKLGFTGPELSSGDR